MTTSADPRASEPTCATGSPPTRELLIGGRASSPRARPGTSSTRRPRQVIATVGGASADQVDEAVAAAREAFPAWAALSGEERARHIHRFADVLEAAADRLLPSIVNEVGTPVSLAEYLQVQDGRRGPPALGRRGRQGRPHRCTSAAATSRVPTESDVVYEPVGVRRRDHRLQLPAQPRDLQVRRGARRRLHGRPAARRRGRR